MDTQTGVHPLCLSALDEVDLVGSEIDEWGRQHHVGRLARDLRIDPGVGRDRSLDPEEDLPEDPATALRVDKR